MSKTLFDKINKAAGNLKCYTGFHKGKWQYLHPNSCEQELDCERCGHKKRIVHEAFTRWIYEKAGLCVQSRDCKRCSHTDFRTRHNFNYKTPIGALDCRAHRQICGRCGHEEDEWHATPQHNWSRWQPTLRQGQRYRFCKDCGRREFRH